MKSRTCLHWNKEQAITYADQVAQFCKVVAEVGGRVVTVNEGEDVNALVRKLYPDAKRIASNLKNITCATFHPDDVEASADLDGTDLAVVDGRIGVCENGAVWVQQDVEGLDTSARPEKSGKQHARGVSENRYRRVWLRGIHFWSIKNGRY